MSGTEVSDVPEENRAQFIAELDIDNISTRELKKAVNDLKQSQEEKEDRECEAQRKFQYQELPKGK